MARPGDIVMLTKGPAIETAALFAVTFPERISALLGEDVARAGENLFGQMSVVRDALAAASAGVRDRGVTAMHDATERGVLGGLAEIADASGTGLLVDLDAAAVRPEVAAICRLFAVDPFTTSSEGTLLLTCRPHAAEEVAGRLTAQGIDAYCIGEVVPAERGLWVVRDGRELPLEPPVTDPFWPAYRRALEERR
jgi:hydrogenase maturation factor